MEKNKSGLILLVVFSVLLVGFMRWQMDAKVFNSSGSTKASTSSGKTVPDFSVTSLKGENISLSKLKGKVVLIDFWATWCGPCRVEMPAVKKVWEKHKNNNFTIIGISLDTDREPLDNYIKNNNITWPQYYDGLGWKNKVAQLYGVRGIPFTVLLDKNGEVAGVSLRGQALANKVDELLQN
ncbi:MAG: TlpA family protein disulfide reductase [Blastocatellia bacterium]|nr:TlpA family protein disulfide reductase [Blastocatellia bacterium]MBN8724955.1 TlpA family protein disulfide reductase [Acidobacteriota bacterium]